MKKAIDLCFKGKQCKYNAITKFGATITFTNII